MCPVMAIQSDLNPPELLAPMEDLRDHEWCVLQTLSSREKRLAWYLAESGIPYFLPMQEEKTVSRNLVRNVLFPGNVFMAYIPGDQTIDIAKESHCVFNILFTKNQPRIRQELALLASETAQRRTLRVEARREFSTGDAVRVRSGPMMGLNGRVVAYHDHSRIFVELSLLGQLISMEIDPSTLEAV